MAKDRWSSPGEWLLHKIQEYREQENWQELAMLAECMTPFLDGDDIQSMFQDDMSQDGYFDDETDTDAEDLAEIDDEEDAPEP